jgi:serine/threonine-protein kinase
MARNGPLYTLLSGAVLGVGLLVAAMVATPAETAADTPEPAAEATESPDVPTPSPEPTPEITTEPAPSPTETETAEPVTYVGYVDGGGASVAVIVTGDDAIAYVCDGGSIEAWLEGSAEAGELDLTGDNGTLTGSFDDLQASGEATADDRSWTFTIEAVDPPEGLYRFADTISGGAEVVGGWIVLPDGSQVGALNVDGEVQPAPALDVVNGQVTVDGTVVQPERLG